MRYRTHVAAGLLIAATFASDAAAAVLDLPVTPLIIRIYAPSLQDPNRVPALAEAQAILTAAGFAPQWLPCVPAPAATDPCAQPLRGAEIAVRIITIAGQPDAFGRLPLGYSLVDAKTRSGALATVYFDRVAWLADAAGVDVAALLGRAVAHEIGHLLLGTSEHGRSGLMRAVWSREAVRNSREGEWRFAAGEARRMRAAASARTASTQMASR